MLALSNPAVVVAEGSSLPIADVLATFRMSGVVVSVGSLCCCSFVVDSALVLALIKLAVVAAGDTLSPFADVLVTTVSLEGASAEMLK